MAESIQLKPCPFCGGTNLFIEEEKGWLICDDCLSTFTQQEITCPEDVAEAWNQRKRSEVLTEGMIETIENPKQTLDNMDDPLEPIKVVSAMKSQSMVLEYRQKNEPDKVNILDYTVIAALWKQIPTKPKKDKYGHDICPSCGWIVNDEWAGQQRFIPHCENCGQALKWAQNEKAEDNGEGMG